MAIKNTTPNRGRGIGRKRGKKTYFVSSVQALVGALFASLLALQCRKSSRARVARFMYCDEGHYFSFVKDNLENALVSKSVELQVVDNSPDILLASTGDLCLKHKHALRVTVLGENIGQSEYSYLKDLSVLSTVVVHTVKLKSELTNMKYFPFWVTSFGERRIHSPGDLIKSESKLKLAVQYKERFCAFMYSHASMERDRLLRIINGYKSVDILGPYPDVGQTTDRYVYNDTVTFYDLAVKHYRKYKFVIAGENSVAEGYITEKIINAMLAYSIPIYIGAPDVSHSFNPGSFINANGMKDSEILHLIKFLDTNDVAYEQMLKTPWFPGNKLPEWFEYKNLSSILSPIIDHF